MKLKKILKSVTTREIVASVAKAKGIDKKTTRFVMSTIKKIT